MRKFLPVPPFVMLFFVTCLGLAFGFEIFSEIDGWRRLHFAIFPAFQFIFSAQLWLLVIGNALFSGGVSAWLLIRSKPWLALLAQVLAWGWAGLVVFFCLMTWLGLFEDTQPRVEDPTQHQSPSGRVSIIGKTSDIHDRMFEARLVGKGASPIYGRYGYADFGLHYDGFRLTSENEILIPKGSVLGLDEDVRLPAPVPDYASIAGFLSVPGTAAAQAWIFPDQMQSVFYVSREGVEAALVVPASQEIKPGHGMEVTYRNHSGKHLIRMRVNGWDVVSEVLEAGECGSVRKAWVPERLSPPLHVEWLLMDETEWHDTVVDRLDEVKVPQGRTQIGSGLELVLQWENRLFAKSYTLLVAERRGFDPERFPDTGTVMAGQGGRNCRPSELNWPGRITLHNMTDGQIRDSEGWFTDVPAGGVGSLWDLREPAFFSKNLSSYHLLAGRGMTLEFERKAESASSLPSAPIWRRIKMPLPVPDPTGMERLLKTYPFLAPADFGMDFYVYPDRIESEMSLRRDSQAALPLQWLNVGNLTGRPIGRVRLGGQSIATDGTRGVSLSGSGCGGSMYTQISPLVAPVEVSYQWVGDSAWNVVRIDSLPPLPPVPQGVKADEVYYSLFLGKPPNYLLVVQRNEVKILPDGSVGVDARDYAGDSEARVRAFLASDRVCTDRF